MPSLRTLPQRRSQRASLHVFRPLRFRPASCNPTWLPSLQSRIARRPRRGGKRFQGKRRNAASATQPARCSCSFDELRCPRDARQSRDCTRAALEEIRLSPTQKASPVRRAGSPKGALGAAGARDSREREGSAGKPAALDSASLRAHDCQSTTRAWLKTVSFRAKGAC